MIHGTKCEQLFLTRENMMNKHCILRVQIVTTRETCAGRGGGSIGSKVDRHSIGWSIRKRG